MSGIVNIQENSIKISQELNELNSTIQEINDLKKFVEIERKKYNKYKILIDILNDLRKSNQHFDNNLKSKLTNIILNENCKQLIEIEDKFDRKYNLFGLNFNEEENLNYFESKQLKELLELELNQKSKNLAKEFQQLTKTNLNKLIQTNSGDDIFEDDGNEGKIMVELQEKLKSEQDLYLENLFNLQGILEELVNLRLKRSPEVIDKKIQEFETVSKINQLRSKILFEKVRVDIFNETKNSFNAYDELIKDIKEQQDESRNSILELNDLKKKYKLVSSTQFDDILKSFIQYKNNIEKKKLLYECIKH